VRCGAWLVDLCAVVWWRCVVLWSNFGQRHGCCGVAGGDSWLVFSATPFPLILYMHRCFSVPIRWSLPHRVRSRARRRFVPPNPYCSMSPVVRHASPSSREAHPRRPLDRYPPEYRSGGRSSTDKETGAAEAPCREQR